MSSTLPKDCLALLTRLGVSESAFAATGLTARSPITGETVATLRETAGAIAIGARPILVAYNVWLADDDLALARRIASAVRTPQLRTLGLQVGDRVQVSMNLVDPEVVGPAAATDAVAALAPIAGCELVGLVPEAVLRALPGARWAALDLSLDRTIEARLRERQAP